MSVPATRWRCGRFTLPVDRPLVMGILNVTPDSFSDGGRFIDPDAAVSHAREMIAAGAGIIDVGGESTRPGAPPVSSEEELARVLPVVEALGGEPDVPVSIDTRHAVIARACVDAGASTINDVSGFRDPAMIGVAAACDAGLVVMHMLGEPQTMQDEPHYDDVVAEVRGYLLARARELEEAGIARERIALDPGIGFGKTTQHNLALLRDLDAFVETGYPIVVGASRKRFIGDVTGESEPDKRLAGSVAAAIWSASRGIHVLRVHDVRETVAALAVTDAVRWADR
ncbi:MAG: dihydropteroate synthase [Coriobacteriia bacterium]|nr:dihydropteroate synthase [Coriobacteriia bacterium]